MSGRDVTAGFLAGLTAIPTALATALLVFGALGSGFEQISASAALYSLFVGGIVVALLANSSPVIPVPLIGPNLVLLSLVVTIMNMGPQSASPTIVVVSLALCVLLGGLWQILLGASGFASAVNFVPYPVVAGFLNGIAILTVVSQLKPLFKSAAGLQLWPNQPATLLFMLSLVALIVWFPALMKPIKLLRTIPGPLAALVVGVGIYLSARSFWPGLNLGNPLGRTDIAFPPHFSMAPLAAPDFLAQMRAYIPEILAHSLASAGIATIETFFATRLAQNAVDAQFSPRRQIVAFGAANAFVASAGGLILSGQPSLTMMAISVGGRTRFTPLVMALTVLLFGILSSAVLAIIPIAVLSAILIATSFRLFDPWTLKLVPAVVNSRSKGLRRRAINDLLVVACVMAITVFYSVIGGIVAGCILACFIFILRMSEPVVQGVVRDMRSKRVRTSTEVQTLSGAMQGCVVLKLRGILFFGNADDLASEIKDVQENAAVIVLDCKKVSEIDVSGANALRATLERTRRIGKQLRFCNVPPPLVEAFVDALAIARPDLLRDLDATLGQIEDDVLLASGRAETKQVGALRDVDLLRGITPEDIALLDRLMPVRRFKRNELLCREGDKGDRMWLLLSGTVSIGLLRDDRILRLASLGPGTTIGEIAMFEQGTRSADITADDDIECRELTRAEFDGIMRDHPRLAALLVSNISQALARRLRTTNAELRAVSDEFL